MKDFFIQHIRHDKWIADGKISETYRVAYKKHEAKIFDDYMGAMEFLIDHSLDSRYWDVKSRKIVDIYVPPRRRFINDRVDHYDR